MKKFAHRGWSAGKGENTISSFIKASDANLDGVEFDVRLSVNRKSVVLSHDPSSDESLLTLDDALKFLATTNLELLIEFKEYSDDFLVLVVQHLRKYNLVERSVIFAFPHVAKQFPWERRHDIKFGIIAPYPHHISKYIKGYKPDMVLMGWGTTRERAIFRFVWKILSLEKVFAKHPSIKFVIGVLYSEKERTWLSGMSGLYCTTVDMPLK